MEEEDDEIFQGKRREEKRMGERTKCSVEIARRVSARAVELGRRAANEPIIAETAFGGSRVTASSNYPSFVRAVFGEWDGIRNGYIGTLEWSIE